MEKAGDTGYSSRFLALSYALASPLYDLLVWWGFLPLGGEQECRRQFSRWLHLQPGLRVASLCCGSGTMERALLAEEPELEITGIDLGSGQIARARKKSPDGRLLYKMGNAAQTGLATGRFDRVLIALALHEMTRSTRLSVLHEAHRLCTPAGRVLAIEHGRPGGRASACLRALWWFFWIPGNPELATSRDLQRHGLDNEMRSCRLHVIERHTTRPDWIEAFAASPTPLEERHTGTKTASRTGPAMNPQDDE